MLATLCESTRLELICRIDPWVNAGRVLWVLCTTTSAPHARGDFGKRSEKPRCAPWALSTSKAAPFRWTALAMASRSEHTPSYVGYVKTTRFMPFSSANACSTCFAATESFLPVDGQN